MSERAIEEYVVTDEPFYLSVGREVELFEAANEQLADNRRRYRQTPRGARFLLQGLLVCPGCGYAWCGQARTGQPTSSGARRR